MKVAITGASGFIGSSIVRGLKDKVDFVAIPHRFFADSSLVAASLSDKGALIHLAAVSSVGDCENNLRGAYEINVGTTCYLAEIFFRQNKGGHFIYPSTGQVYDETEPMPHAEGAKVAPGNAYARSKLCAELGLVELAKQLGGRLTILRMYNYAHKSQSPRFLLPSILKQIQDSPTANLTLKVGNIDIDRDLSAIQDLVEAFGCLLSAPQDHLGVATYNLSSSVPKNLKQVILSLAEQFGKKVTFEIETERIRVNEPQQIYGDPTKFIRQFRWAPRSRSIPEFLQLFLEDL